MRIECYDLETYRNFFCGVFSDKNKSRHFEISDRINQTEELLEYYEDIDYACGFNNIAFDAQVMHFIFINKVVLSNMNGSDAAKKIFDFVQSALINRARDEFPPYNELDFKTKQIDIFRILHYDNVSKRCSLKWTEFSLRWEKLQDLPYSPESRIETHQMDEIIEYCYNDVNATKLLLREKWDIVKLRVKQSRLYPSLNLLNKPDSSVGETIFLYEMSKEMSIPMNKLKKLRTYRGSIPIKDLLLDYISFETKEFNSVLDFYKKSWSGGVSKSIKYQGVVYEYGEGGLHASVENKIYESNKDKVIIDLDVASFYPNLAIVNNFRPEHLGDSFGKVYKNIYEERKKYPKGSPENASYKIILNGSYGKLGSEYSFLYDIKPKLQICINGQLLLSMLAEKLSQINSCEIIQCNTDGVTIYIDRKYSDKVENVRKEWEKITNLELEDAIYKKMVITNVNNYLAVYENGKVKSKGALFEVDGEIHKNNSQRCVRVALYNYFVNNIPINETFDNYFSNPKWEVDNHGIYDFCIGRKKNKNQKYVITTGIDKNRVPIKQTIEDKVIRYYITNTTGRLTKEFYNDDKEFEKANAVNSGFDVKLFMKYTSEPYDINYAYYKQEVNKILYPLIINKLQGSLF